MYQKLPDVLSCLVNKPVRKKYLILSGSAESPDSEESGGADRMVRGRE